MKPKILHDSACYRDGGCPLCLRQGLGSPPGWVRLRTTQHLNVCPMFRDALRSVGSRELLPSQEVPDFTLRAMDAFVRPLYTPSSDC